MNATGIGDADSQDGHINPYALVERSLVRCVEPIGSEEPCDARELSRRGPLDLTVWFRSGCSRFSTTLPVTGNGAVVLDDDGFVRAVDVRGDKIGRASCRERV